MKKILHLLKSIDKQLRETETQTDTVSSLPFYKIFKQDEQQEIDLAILREHKRELLNRKYAALENLQLEIEKVKADINSELKELTNCKINSHA